MGASLFIEQLFNGFGAGVTLFLVAAGLTLVLGIMNFVNLAHGAQIMIGAYSAAALTAITGNFWAGVALSIPIVFISGWCLELLIMRHLYKRDHMEQVLVTFGLILFFNELIRLIFGPASLYSALPPSLSGFIYIFPQTPYPIFRVLIIIVGLICALSIHLFVRYTKTGAMLRAGASNPDMAAAMGMNTGILFRFIFAVGATLAGFAGMLLGPLTSVEPGMGEPLLILCLVVIIIGGIGSIKGAFIASILVGMSDTLGRIMLPTLLRGFMDDATADGTGTALASMMVYIVMAGVLIFRPSGLFPATK